MNLNSQVNSCTQTTQLRLVVNKLIVFCIFSKTVFLDLDHLMNVLQCAFWCTVGLFHLSYHWHLPVFADLYSVLLESELQMIKWNRQTGTCLPGISQHLSLIFAIHECFSPAMLYCSVFPESKWGTILTWARWKFP